MSRGAGYLAVGTAAVLWAVGGAVASYLIDQGASFRELTEARAWITALVLGLLLWARRGRAGGRRAGRAPVGLVGLFGLALAAVNFTYYAALSLLPVAVAITVQYTAPALVVLWAAGAEGLRPSRRVAGALVLALGGVALLAELPVLAGSGALRLSGAGFAFAAASAVAFATYIVVGERVGRLIGTHRAVFGGFAVAAVLWAVVQATQGRPDTLLDARFVPGVLFLAVATTIAPFLLFVWGLEQVRAPRAGIVSTLEPLTAALIAFVWLHQSLSGWQLAGGAMVLLGIAVVRAERGGAEVPAPERASLG